jgi:hypothetical protein
MPGISYRGDIENIQDQSDEQEVLLHAKLGSLLSCNLGHTLRAVNTEDELDLPRDLAIALADRLNWNVDHVRFETTVAETLLEAEGDELLIRTYFNGDEHPSGTSCIFSAETMGFMIKRVMDREVIREEECIYGVINGNERFVTHYERRVVIRDGNPPSFYMNYDEYSPIPMNVGGVTKDEAKLDVNSFIDFAYGAMSDQYRT